MTTAPRSFLARDPRSIVLTVIVLGAVARIVLAMTIGLGVDESYAVAVARQYSLSYFDHPPLHFWMAGAVAKLFHSEAGVVVRLPFIACFAGTTWLLFRLTTRLFDARAGALAAVLLNISAVFSLSTGGWVLPDGPLMVLMLGAANIIADLLFDECDAPVQWWMLAGLLTGVAMLAKYHGAIVLGGTTLFLLTSAPHRKWLATPGPWLGAAIAALCFTPVLVWNSQHHWVSFAFQGGRAVGRSGIHVGAMLTNIAGQMGWVLPWIFVPLAASFWRAVRAGPRDEKRWFLACLAVAPIAVFTLIALRGDVGLPHWQAPGWLFVFPMLGAAAAERMARGATAPATWIKVSAATFVVIVTILASHAATGWIERLAPQAFAKGDPSTDALDWKHVRVSMKARGYLPTDGFLAAPSWIQAGKAAIGVGPEVPVICLCADPHHFYYMQPADTAFRGANAVFVVKKRPNDDTEARFSRYFAQFMAVDDVPITRGGRVAFYVTLWRGVGFKPGYPTGQPR